MNAPKKQRKDVHRDMQFTKAIATCALAIGLVGLANFSPATADDNVDPNPDSGLAVVENTDGSTTFSSNTSRLTINPAASPTPSKMRGVQLAYTFTCKMNVEWPHGSTHYNGTINVVVTVKCDIPARHLRLATSLIRVSPNTAQWHAGTKNNDNKARIQNNAATDCDEGPGNFRGWGWGTITAPPGYQLSGPADYDKYGDTKPVACGVSIAADADSTEASEQFTVTFVRSDLIR